VIDFYFPGFRQKAGGLRIDQMYGRSSLIAGFLISKAYFDEYSAHWKGDLERARKHYDSLDLKLFGDSGAFSFIEEATPPISVKDVIDFYNQIDADLGASLDHVIPDYDASYDYFFGGISAPQKYLDRMEITLENGSVFLRECEAQGVRFTPIGSIQGWSPKSYIECIKAFQKMGYKKVALGGIAKLSKPSLKQLLTEVKEVIGDTEIHLFGITQPQLVRDVGLPNITSVDGMGPYMGGVIRGEYFKTSTERYKCFPVATLSDEVCNLIEANEYEKVRAFSDPNTNFNVDQTIKGLGARYWESCDCVVCSSLGVKSAIHHSDTGRHHGFHNVYVVAKEFKFGV
jgi:hypothetical protein